MLLWRTGLKMSQIQTQMSYGKCTAYKLFPAYGKQEIINKPIIIKRLLLVRNTHCVI